MILKRTSVTPPLLFFETGLTGLKGEKGNPGIGTQGPRGPPGPAGKSFYLAKMIRYKSLWSLHRWRKLLYSTLVSTGITTVLIYFIERPMCWLQSTSDVSLKRYSTFGFILIGWVRRGYSKILLLRAWWYNESLPHICTFSGICGKDSAMLDLVSSTPSKKQMKKAHQSQFPKYGDV